MTDHPGADRPHPVAAALATVTDALASTADTPVWALDGSACRDLLVQLTQAGSQLAELTTRVAHRADVVEAGPNVGATSTPTCGPTPRANRTPTPIAVPPWAPPSTAGRPPGRR